MRKRTPIQATRRTNRTTKGESKQSTPQGRYKSVRVKTARGRKLSSTRWLQRQLNDPYVQEAQRLGYRSRAAFKLLQIDDKVGVLKPGATVVDLGASPGGWTQVCVERVGKGTDDKVQVLALDIQPMDPVDGALTFEKDIFDEDILEFVTSHLGSRADVVVSDMSPKTTGHPQTDHLRIIGLCEAALDVAITILNPGGHFVAKVFQGGTEGDLLKLLRANFDKIKHFKPDASRKGSPETYVIAMGFKGVAEDN